MEANAYKIMERAVEEGVRHGWYRAHKHLNPGQMPSEGAAIGTITDAVMLHVSEFFEFDSPSLKDKESKILEIIERSLRVKGEALGQGNREQMGYPYCAGYMESALAQIASIIRSSARNASEET